MYGGALLIGIVFFIISMIASSILKRKFRKYSKTWLSSGLSGKEIARQMLADHGIFDVEILCVPGQLTDHYDPTNKTVNLSPEVYDGVNAASAAVAAHEGGHAVQHAQAYSMLSLRSALVPIQNVSSRIMNIIVMVGMFGGFYFATPGIWPIIIYTIIAIYGVFTLFSFVTLPVEFDASRRALLWMSQERVVTQEEQGWAKDALKWAAMTYVIAALGSLATLLYYISLLTGRD